MEQKTKQSLSAFLIMPGTTIFLGIPNSEKKPSCLLTLFNIVQRLPRYEMLLSAVISHTSEDHVDYANLRQSHEYIKEVLLPPCCFFNGAFYALFVFFGNFFCLFFPKKVNKFINERKRLDEQNDVLVSMLNRVDNEKKKKGIAGKL